jgi:hypothetical protein
MSENRRRRNIVNDLSRKKTLFGIPSAFCNWYLDNPQYKNPAFDFLFDKMITASVNVEAGKGFLKMGEGVFNDKRSALEKKYVAPEVMKGLTPQEVDTSRKIGLIAGILVFAFVVYLYWRYFLS